MKTKNKIIRTALSVAVLSSLYSIANADTNPGGTVGTQQIATSIVMPSYTDQELANAGCAKPIWTQMVSDYQRKATVNTSIRNQIQVQNQRDGSPTADQVGRCFDSAAQTINNATRAYNTISSFLSGGGLDPGKLYDYAQKVVVGAACSQVNSYVSQSGLTTTLNGSIGGVNNGLGTVLGTGSQVGGVNTGSVSDILNGGGYKPNTTGTVPNINGTTIVTGSGVTGTINNINPFK